jgi:hypothetical protein
MKTFKEYLTESKKVYSFKIKVAGEVPEKFEESLKTRLGRCNVLTLEKQASTPIQALPIDFPELKNCEVSIYEMICEYPLIADEIKHELVALEMCPTHFRVKNSSDPTEEYQATMNELQSDSALLTDDKYKEAGKVKQKDYFGADYNKGFLKDLEKVAKARKKELGQKDIKGGEKDAGLDFGSASKSPVGSHQNTIPDPIKG